MFIAQLGMSKMLLKAVALLLLLTSMVSPSPLITEKAVSDDAWSGLDEPSSNNPEPSLTTPCPPLKLPQYQQIDSSDVHKLIFKPAKHHRPIPDWIKYILLPSPLPTTEAPSTSKASGIDLLCHLDRIYVRVVKSLFTSSDAEKYLKVGTCPVNKATNEHYYFLYPIGACDVQRQENENHVLYLNMLSYQPVTDEPVIRELPFSVPLECRYRKHFRTYSNVGYHPQVESGTVFLSLQGGVSLTPVDENWEPLATWQSYTIGQPMYFEAKAPQNPDGKRLYFSKCYITATQSPDSTPNYTIMDNYGCMVDSKNTPLSKFYPSNDHMTLRFSVGALVFKDVASETTEKEMFLHCEMYLGPETPTSSTKSCYYSADIQGWMELYGDNSVCACCDSTCPAPDPSVGMKLISSNSWEVENQQTDQPAQKSFNLGTEVVNYADSELFWEKS